MLQLKILHATTKTRHTQINKYLKKKKRRLSHSLFQCWLSLHLFIVGLLFCQSLSPHSIKPAANCHYILFLMLEIQKNAPFSLSIYSILMELFWLTLPSHMPMVSLPPPYKVRDIVLPDPHRMESVLQQKRGCWAEKNNKCLKSILRSQEGTNLMEEGGCWYQWEEKEERQGWMRKALGTQ